MRHHPAIAHSTPHDIAYAQDVILSILCGGIG